METAEKRASDVGIDVCLQCGFDRVAAKLEELRRHAGRIRQADPTPATIDCYWDLSKVLEAQLLEALEAIDGRMTEVTGIR